MSFAYVDPKVLRARHKKPPLAQEHSQPSREAAARIERVRPTLRKMVYEAIRESRAGLTDEEIQQETGIGPSTERPRRVELLEMGLVIDSQRTRPGKSGRAMTVWQVRDSAIAV